jgi:hypothetical protein
MNTTITKAVIAAVAAFGALVQTHTPMDTNQWLIAVAESLGAGALVWYVPNTPKSGGGTQ